MGLARRGFLFLCAAAPPALWLAGHGVVSISGRMVLDLVGWCSFCGPGPSNWKQFGMAGVVGRSQRVCSDCVGLCLEILREEKVVEKIRANLPVTADRASEIEDVLRSLRDGSAESAELVERIRRVLDGRAMAYDSTRPDACSFCDAARRDCFRLISGPRVFICDGCISEATALLVRHGWSGRREAS